MFGHNASPSIRIEAENNFEYVTNGDVIRGKLIVESPKSFSVRNIEVKLRCEEFAYVLVSNGQTSHYVKETVRYLSLNNTVFPDRSVRQHADTDPNVRFTLQAGCHEFPFQFQIPLAEGYPESITVKDHNSSGIRWYVKAAIHRGVVLAQTKRFYKELEMRPSRGFSPDDSRMSTGSAEEQILTYLPGYSTWLKTASGKLKDMLPGNTHYKKKIPVKLVMIYPEAGILQQPHPVNVLVNIVCDEPDLLTIKHVDLQLKQKIVVSVNDGSNYAVYRELFPILTLKNLNMELKPGLEHLTNILLETTLQERVPSNMRNQHFDLSYKLVLTVTFGSKEKAGSLEKVRLSVPVYVNYFVPRNPDTSLAYEPLPIYQIEPHSGEYTIANPIHTRETQVTQKSQ